MSLWKRLQRKGKNASKFEFNISYHHLVMKCKSIKWFPYKVGINWTRRSRDIRIEVHDWVPCLNDPCMGKKDWTVPENVSAAITLYRAPREEEFEDKDWVFNLESINQFGKRKAIASTKINMKNYASVSPMPQELEVELKNLSDKYKDIKLSFTISCSLIKEGLATDDDMISLASLMSYGSAADRSADDGSDIGNLADFDGLDSNPSFASLTAQIGSFIRLSEMDVQNWDNTSESGVTDAIKPMYIGTPPDTPKLKRQDDAVPEPGNVAKPLQQLPFHKEKSPDLKQLDSDRNITKSQLDDKPKVTVASKDILHGRAQPSLMTASTVSSTSDDLLAWAQSITRNYDGIKVTNFTTSWRNGMAFCALIHYYRNDLIDMTSLDPRDVKQNNKIAFDAAASLGITRIIEPADMVVMKVPDKLQVKTFLHELRSHFTGHVMETKAHRSGLASYIFGLVDYEPESAVAEIKGQSISRILPTRHPVNPFATEQIASHSPATSTSRLSSSQPATEDENDLDAKLERYVCLKEESPEPIDRTGELKHNNVSQEKPKATALMTRKELLNPFDSDDDADDNQTVPDKVELTSTEDHQKISRSPETCLDKLKDASTPVLKSHMMSSINKSDLNPHQKTYNTQLQEKHSLARSKLSHDATQEKILKKTQCKKSEEERYKELRTRARELLYQARSKQSKHAGLNTNMVNSESSEQASDQAIYDVNEYVYLELASIEKDQLELDKQASFLEKELRKSMNEGDHTREEMLTQQWFYMISRRNELIHRQEELNILEKEENLNVRYDLLKRELRNIMSLEEWEKSDYQKQKEQSLLEELVMVVNKRDALVTQIEQQQASLQEDESSKTKVKLKIPQLANAAKEQCLIQ